MKAGRDQKTVFVGMSGGVDSSVAAYRLIKAGYNVVGVFIKVWQPDFLECNWEQERLDAMRVAAHLDIPFLTCDAAETYKQEVGDYFVSEYAAGRTPNPDVMCNKSVKFGAFLDFAKAHGADYIATGHYARTKNIQNPNVQTAKTQSAYQLLRGVDADKDQSYFLWTLTQKQLAHALFPVGDTLKDDIRFEAKRAGLPTAAKKDSQGVCFLGHIDVASFLSHFVTLTPGNVLDTDGTVIGQHDGALIYTIGQRHGFTIDHAQADIVSHYVVAKDVVQNTITVATESPELEHGDTIALINTHWIADTPEADTTYTAQFRYRQRPVSVTVSDIANDTATIRAIDRIDAPAPGQSCVLYNGDICLGGGIIRG